MKYDENIYNLSKQVNRDIIPSFESDNNTKKIQTKLLLILFKKFDQKLKNDRTKNGLLKIKINREFYQKPEDGYDEISQLISYDSFDSFAKEYCIYLGEVQTTCDEFRTAYYEIIWDYKTYFESLKGKDLQKAKKDYCKTNGHNFGKWKEDEFPLAAPPDVESYIYWERKCKRCGYVEEVRKKPVELRIKELEKTVEKANKELKLLKQNKGE